jgi:DNA-directed RNA polymerase III subunit RPC3
VGYKKRRKLFVSAYCLFFLVLKFCAERKKAKLKLSTLAIWEAFLEANVTDNDNKTGNIEYLAQML